MDYSRVVKLASGFVIEPMGEEFTVYHPTQTITIYLNQTGALLWQLCDGRRSVAEMVGLLAGIYPDNRHEVELEVSGFIEMLVERGVAELY